MKKSKENAAPFSLKLALIIIAAVTITAVAVLGFIKGRQGDMRFISRYTYIKKLSSASVGSMTQKEEADQWFKEFIGQFTGTLVPAQHRLRDVKVETLDESGDDGVRLVFSGVPSQVGSDFFAEWNPRYINGRMQCDWTMKLGVEKIDDRYDGIYIISMEDNVRDDAGDGGSGQGAGGDTENDFIRYRITGTSLEVSFDDGGSYVTVPVDLKNLPVKNGDELEPGSYCLMRENTAFITGGATINGEKVPAGIVYSNDGGESWITGEIDQIFDISYYYLKMFDANDGVAVLGYAQTENQEFSKVYVTHDGGDTWEPASNGPQNLPLKGVNYISPTTAFFCYEYSNTVPNNLFVTRDGGKTFNAVTFAAQQLDSDAGDKKWEDIYKEAEVPVQDADGLLTVYLTQGEGGTYHDGLTAAKYTSSDEGLNWKFVEQTQSR